MNRDHIKGSTLPELLVVMLLAGIVLLIAFEGLSMIQAALRQSDLSEFGADLSRLQQHEILLETTDSTSVGDSVRYFRDGVVVETLARWQ